MHSRPADINKNLKTQMRNNARCHRQAEKFCTEQNKLQKLVSNTL
jgi:hypothetical protein